MKRLVLTFSRGIITVCGHFFELFDYFIYLKQFFENVIAVVPSSVTFDRFLNACKYRYKNKYLDLLNDVKYDNCRVMVYPDDIVLFFDGSPVNQYVKCDTFIGTMCSRLPAFVVADKAFMLADERIYTESFIAKNRQLLTRHTRKHTSLIDFEFVHYVKKILFEAIEYRPCDDVKDYLFYITKGWKDIEIQHLFKKYPVEKSLIVSDRESIGVKPPVENLFAKFKAYVYTGTSHKFDCSNRMVKECQFFGKDVIFEIDYYDKALDIRFRDPLDDVNLKYDSFIVDFLKDLGVG